MSTSAIATRFGSALAAAALVLAGLGTGASAQTRYNPEDGGQIVSQIFVELADGTRVNSESEIIGQLGVEQCKDQLGKRVTFTYQINQNFGLATGTANSGIEYNEANLLEFGADNGIDGQCNHDGEQTACRRLSPDDEGVFMTPEPGGFLTQRTVEISVEFDELITHFDSAKEACAFVGSGQPPGPADAGMGADAGTMADAGTGGTGTAEGADRFYVVRAFFTGREISGIQERETKALADAPLLLDRTRPPRPSVVQAGATENVLKVAFQAPSETADVQDYFAYLSNQPLDSSATPEELKARESVEVRPLSGVQAETDEGGGRRTGKVTGIDQTEGDKLYVGVVSRDEAENASELKRAEQSPIDVQKSVDFWEKYKEAGGVEPGGCACNSAPGGLPTSLLTLLVGLGGLVFARGRTRI